MTEGGQPASIPLAAWAQYVETFVAQNALPDDPTPVPLNTLPLDDWHRRHGARMVPFAGYSMPVQYDLSGDLADRCRGGVMAEHLHTRRAAGLFDVSHMGQAFLTGTGVADALERLVPADIAGLRPGRQRYTMLTNEAGGIIDDLMVTKLANDRLFLVVNASRKDVDFRHLAANLPEDIRVEPLEDRALLTLQGPAAAAVIGRLSPEAAMLAFLGFTTVRIFDIECHVSRSGYTGEDGFEISVPIGDVAELADTLVAHPEVVPIGLGARDSLRLEAGLCLYGNDLDELTSPVEAGLTWTIGKRRKLSWDFPGGSLMRDQLDHGATRVRVGIRPDGRTPARAQTTIVAEDGTEAGTVTSGGFGPSLNAPIAMGYVRRDLAADGTKLSLIVRGKTIPATVVPLPFVPHRYVR
jgi:aminomethyltransferase